MKHWLTAWNSMEHQKRIEALMTAGVVVFGIFCIAAVLYAALGGGK